MVQYKNRYNSIYNFELQEDGNILWIGNFEYCRFGMPNDYTKAYNSFVADGGKLSFNEFKEEVHKYDEKNHKYVYDKYVVMVESLKDKIDMVDPSGGCYIASGMDMGFLDKSFKGMIVKEFEKVENGYLIIIK